MGWDNPEVSLLFYLFIADKKKHYIRRGHTSSLAYKAFRRYLKRDKPFKLDLYLSTIQPTKFAAATHTVPITIWKCLQGKKKDKCLYFGTIFF